MGFSGDPNLWGKGGLEIVKGGLHSDRVVPKRAMGQEVTILGIFVIQENPDGAVDTGHPSYFSPLVSNMWLHGHG